MFQNTNSIQCTPGFFSLPDLSIESGPYLNTDTFCGVAYVRSFITQLETTPNALRISKIEPMITIFFTGIKLYALRFL